MQQTPEAIIQDLQVKDKLLFDWIGRLEVKDDASKKNAENLLIDARFAQKRAQETQKNLLEPIREADKRIRDLFRPYLDKLGLAISRISTLLDGYHGEQERIAKEEAEYLAAETAAKLADARETGEVVDLPSVTVESPTKTSRTDLGKVTYVDDYDIQIVNPDLVPRDLCEPSMSKIRARVKSGVRDILGVLVTTKHVLRTTRAR